MPSLQRLADQLVGKPYQVIGISVDSDRHIVREFLIDKKIHFRNYLDVSMSIANSQLGVRVFPSTFLIDGSGRLIDVVEAWRYWDEPGLVARILSLH